MTKRQAQVQSSDHPPEQPTPTAAPVGKPTEHRPPAPSPAEHNATFKRPTPAEDRTAGVVIREGINSTSHGIR